MRRASLAVGVWVAVAAGSLFWLQAQPFRWDDERQATCMPDDCFCEAVREGPIRQPADTWSCLAYVLVGGLIMGSGARPARVPGATKGLDPLAFGLVVVFLGAASAYFHASLTFRGEWFDALSMYLFPGILIAHNLRRSGSLGATGSLAVFCAVAVASGLFHALVLAGRKEAFASILAIFVLSELWASRGAAVADRRFLWSAAGTFAAAFAVWWLDYSRAVCSPHSLWQGHSAWHLLCAAALGFLFLHYRPGVHLEGQSPA